MKFIKYIIVLITVLNNHPAYTQNAVKTLSALELAAIVRQYHPIAKQADIFVEKAKADVTISRGMFDPVLQNEGANKTFDGINYYQYNRPELVVPTWFGIEVSAGLEYLGGSRTAPDETKGESSFMGISVPLAKNLLMDKRRAALQTAKIFREASEIEKRKILNDLLQEALVNYWNWVQHYQVYQVLNSAIEVNEQRVRLVKTAFQLGERPAIDTSEALSQLQQFQIQRSQAWLEFQNAGLDLSVFLWTQSLQPYDLPETIIPADNLQALNISSAAIPVINDLLDAAQFKHPELLIYNYKLDILGVEKKLKFQDLLPDVNFKYNQLGKGYDVLKTATGPLYQNNFQYGISIGVPLRFSQGRGEYKKIKLKISETELQQSDIQLQVLNKVKSYFNELTALKEQVSLQEKVYQNFAALQRGEEIRFRSGESSLFLVNARETKALEALQKLQELKSKFYQTIVKLQWGAGLLVP